MNIKKLLGLIILVGIALATQAQDYTNGVFILNEDWYGHNNSSLNFLNPATGEFDYEVIRTNEKNEENHLSLGCTSQFGTIYGDRIYIVSKQDQDPGEKEDVHGGRLVVADARTMEIIKSFPEIYEMNGKSAADGRGFVGVNKKKGYIGTTNGIFVLDLDNLQIKGRISGTENPLITGDESNGDGLGSLYRNQIGMMIRAYDHVFAIQQDKGILVIDPENDTVEQVIPGCFSTMTQSKDGTIWAGKNSNMDYQTYPYGNVGSSGEEWEGTQLLKINPFTLESKIIDMPNGIGINQTWYAWTAGSLCASAKQNRLYFTFNPDKWNWFTCSLMYMYDIDENTFYKIYDSNSENRYFYGAGIRINPLNDELYAAMYLDNIDQTYFFYGLDNEGNRQNVFEPIKRYWFPALFIFPDNYAPAVSDFAPVTLKDGQTVKIGLGAMAADEDNLTAAIIKRIVGNDNETGLRAAIRNDTLTVTAIGEKHAGNIIVRFNSNGKTVDKIVAVHSDVSSGINVVHNSNVQVFNESGNICIAGLRTRAMIRVFNAVGKIVWSGNMCGTAVVRGLPAKQIYFVKVDAKTYKIIL